MTPPPPPAAGPRGWLALLFVALYGSGFVGARLGLPHAGPFTFLALRFALAAALLAGIAACVGAPWPRRRGELLHIAGAGLLGVGVFSAGVFCSIALGLPPAVSALIIALHPLLVALGAGPLLGERVGARQWGGLLLGLLGVYLVLHTRLQVDPDALPAALLSLLGLFGLSAGNLYQKRHCADMNLFAGGAVQCAACAVAAALGAAACENGDVAWTAEFVAALVWMAAIVSVGALSLLYVLIRHGEVSRVAGIFYLVPVSAALCAYALFGQGIDATAQVGIGVAAIGVILAMRAAAPGNSAFVGDQDEVGRPRAQRDQRLIGGGGVPAVERGTVRKTDDDGVVVGVLAAQHGGLRAAQQQLGAPGRQRGGHAAAVLGPQRRVLHGDVADHVGGNGFAHALLPFADGQASSAEAAAFPSGTAAAGAARDCAKACASASIAARVCGVSRLTRPSTPSR